MNTENENKLVNKYWIYSEREGLYPFPMFGFECGDGWFNLIDELSSKICKMIEDNHPDLKETFMVTQVKEKYGTLSFYVSSAYDDIFDLIDEYESLSAHICESCGKAGELRNHGGWYITLCDEHYEQWINR